MSFEKENSADKLRIFWWSPAAALRVSGADSFAFLQGQLTNDLRVLGAGGSVYGLWLDHKGHVHGDGYVTREGAEAFWIFSERTPADSLRRRLEGFVIADDVAIEDRTAEWGGVTVLGRTCADTMAPAPGIQPLERRDATGGQAFVFPIAGREAVRAGWRGAEEMAANEFERRRILAGVPAVPTDIGAAELPQEGGLDQVAISYSKGCYLGQEVMARLHAMGQVRRLLVGVRGAGAPPPHGTALYQGERRVGEIRSTAATDDGFVGFALVVRLHWRADVAFSLRPGGPAVIQVCRRP